MINKEHYYSKKINKTNKLIAKWKNSSASNKDYFVNKFTVRLESYQAQLKK